MFGIIGAALIVLWVLGFFALHVASGLIHIMLLMGIALLVWHFFIGRDPITS